MVRSLSYNTNWFINSIKRDRANWVDLHLSLAGLGLATEAIPIGRSTMSDEPKETMLWSARTYGTTTPITAMGCRQCLPLSLIQLKGKHCRKPHCCNGVVVTLGQCHFDDGMVKIDIVNFITRLMLINSPLVVWNGRDTKLLPLTHLYDLAVCGPSSNWCFDLWRHIVV